MNDSRRKQEVPELLMALMTLLEMHRPIFRQQRVFNRVVALVLAEVFAFARHTVTQLLLTLGITDDDWSAWYRIFSRQRIDEEAAGRVMLEAVVSEMGASELFVTGFDGFQVPRSSRKMPGTSWSPALGTAPFKKGIHRAQRFVEGSWLTPLVNGFSRAIPLRCLPTFTVKAVKSSAPVRKEWEGGWRYLLWLRERLDEMGRQKQPVLALADATFDTIGMWAELPERVSLVARTKRNRCLYWLPTPSSGPGRPAKYGEKAPAPSEWLRRRKGFSHYSVQVRGKTKTMRCRLEGPFLRDGLPFRVLFLLVVGGGKRPPGSRRKRYKPALYLISAVERDGQWQLPLRLPELLPWLWQRWELEVAHREMKSGFGLGDKQCWHVHSAILSVQWSVWTYALLVLAGYRSWGLLGGPQPPGRWRAPSQRWSFNTLWRGYRAAIWGRNEFRASWFPSTDNWLKKEPLLAAMNNAVIAASRA